MVMVTVIMVMVMSVVCMIMLVRGVIAMRIVCMVVMTVTEKIGVNFQSGVEVETPQIKHFVYCNFTKMHDVLRRPRIHML